MIYPDETITKPRFGNTIITCVTIPLIPCHYELENR